MQFQKTDQESRITSSRSTRQNISKLATNDREIFFELYVPVRVKLTSF